MKAFFENKLYAVKWLYFVRDAREGGGERSLFRIIAKHLCREYPEVLSELIQYIPLYGRWDDLWELMDTPLESTIVDIVKAQLKSDYDNYARNEPISLLAKWLPSCNTSSKASRQKAQLIRKHLGMNEAVYRRMLSKLRSHLKVVECDMSANRWAEINYEAVPSRANLIYNNAFLRHDEERRREYLDALERGEVKINSSVLFPHDIVHSYFSGYSLKPHDATLEGMWTSYQTS